MKNFVFNYKDSEGNEKEVALRLTSMDCENIEKQYNCSLINYVQQTSITTLINLLMYMRKGAGETFTKNQAYSFYDELVDSGYTIESMLMEIIYPTLVVSGVLSEEDFKEIKEERDRVKNMTNEEKEEMIKERKNLQK